MIRGKNAAEAAVILQFTPREAAGTVLKVLNSAVANAVQQGSGGAESLKITEAYVDEGPTLKRFRPRARGRASRINKRSSHITIVVSGEERAAAKKAEKAKGAKVAKKSETKKVAKAAAAAKPAKAVKADAKAKKTPAKKASSAKEEKRGSEG
jgi:large subunit ribosomal protein L22